MRPLRDLWRRERRERPAATWLAVLAVTTVFVAPAIAAVGFGLLALLLAGLAVVPLTLSTALFLLPARLWPDEDEQGDGGPGPGTGGGPWPSGGPDGPVDWERFERELWEHIEAQRAVRA
jgi:hypothetical protein